MTRPSGIVPILTLASEVISWGGARIVWSPNEAVTGTSRDELLTWRRDGPSIWPSWARMRDMRMRRWFEAAMGGSGSEAV